MAGQNSQKLRVAGQWNEGVFGLVTMGGDVSGVIKIVALYSIV